MAAARYVWIAVQPAAAVKEREKREAKQSGRSTPLISLWKNETPLAYAGFARYTAGMSSWLDSLPTNERQRIKEKYKLSESAYEKLRQKVKGPEDMEREMEQNHVLAELKFGLETEPVMKQALQRQIENDIAEHGIENVLELNDLSSEIRSLIEKGKFEVTVDESLNYAHDQIVVCLEGNVSDKVPVKTRFAEAYLSGLTRSEL